MKAEEPRVTVRLLAQGESLDGNERGLVLDNVEPNPLKLDDWLTYKDKEGLPVQIRGRVTADSTTEDGSIPPIGEWVNVSLTLEPVVENDCICLVRGGWVPLFYSLANANIIADRNIISEINTRFSGGQLSPPERDRNDFIDFMADTKCGCTLNTLAFALEGNRQELPSLEIIIEQYNSALKILNQSLPHIKTWPTPEVDMAQTEALLNGYRGYFIQGMEFLEEVAPLLMNTPSKSKKHKLWRDILTAAQKTGVSPQHICVAASISAASAGQNFNPAKRIIKPKPTYKKKDAYNAMYDFFLLFLLDTFQEEHPESRSVLLTRDKQLAMFWMGMNVVTTQRDSDSIKRKHVGFHPKLLPFEDEDFFILQEIFGADNIQSESPLMA
ncbi:hypothetical protein [Pseudomonas grandcourensis]|uniref:hypothetical protein n=1 Tax=Pseudomonas grandcourensis TaxID=3136736 RepID=UPI0032663DC5